MEGESYLGFCVVVWVIVIGIVVANRWRKGAIGIGLPIAFLLNLWLIHWPAAVIYLLPWYLYYDVADKLSLVRAGFEQSTYAVIGFGVGSVILAPFLMRLFQFPRPSAIPRLPGAGAARTYLMIGMLCFLTQFSFVSRLPTLSALLVAGWSFLVMGLGLGCWRAWKEKRLGAFAVWLAIALSFPLITIVLMGFLSFGTMVFFSVFAFIVSFFRPRWKLIVLTLVLAYTGISFYGAYMRDRGAIRELIWEEQAPLIDRVEKLYQTATTLEWFNPFNPVHLFFIDARLNMNLQVGQAMDYLAAGHAEYAGGATLWWSVIGMIPRAVWPNKPLISGGSEFVASYTGLKFDEETTVGVGLIMEFFVNFGALGVILGFLTLGVIVMALDVAAADRLGKGDLAGFALRFLPGLALVKAEGSLVELTTTAGAAVVTALLVNSYLRHRLPGKKALEHPRKIPPSIHSVQDRILAD